MSVDMWQGSFGDAYTERNLKSVDRTFMWETILAALPDVPTIILEVGANIGANLKALYGLGGTTLVGLEPNAMARKQIRFPFEAREGTAQAIPYDNNSIEMVFTCGVLIHIPPHDLARACSEILRVSSRYIVCIEYFSDKTEDVYYQGRYGLLWKRDFGSFWMDNYDLSLLGYGFFWKPATGLDNLTWWAFQKNG